MRIVVFEDADEKFSAILDCLVRKGVREQGIHRVRTVAEFLAIAHKNPDLYILDIRMPGVEGGEARSSGREILKMLDYSGKTRVPLIAITAFPEEATACRDDFAARGCIIYEFDKRETWCQAIDIFLAQARDRGRYDFILFTALKKERDSYILEKDVKFDSLTRYGVDHWDFEFEGKSGSVVLLPRMGLVVASAVVARVLEQYAPTVVGMSGICAGDPENSKLGQLLIPDICWEYQSGKWLDEVFEMEPYQVVLDEDVRLILSKLIEDRGLPSRLEAGFSGRFRPNEISSPKIAPFATGSAVIANEKRLASIKLQHRKFAGLDMEAFGFFKAAELSASKPRAICAKVVVDDGSNSKDDRLHEYGCFVSARFMLEAVRALF